MRSLALGDRKSDNCDETLLGANEAIAFRSSAMRLAFVAAHISVLASVANRLARHLAKPTVGAWSRLTRCVRYIHGHSRWIQTFPIQDEVRRLDVNIDSDWAQDQDRKSASCVVTMVGTTVQVATQTTPLSSGEAETVAFRSKDHQFFLVCNPWHETWDEKSRFGSTQTLLRVKGLRAVWEPDKIRHLETGLPWLQHHVSRRNIQIHAVAGPRTKQTLDRKM